MTDKIKLRVKCVICGYAKEVGEEQTEQPVCDKCFSPMIPDEAKINRG